MAKILGFYGNYGDIAEHRKDVEIMKRGNTTNVTYNGSVSVDPVSTKSSNDSSCRPDKCVINVKGNMNVSNPNYGFGINLNIDIKADEDLTRLEKIINLLKSNE